MVFTNMHNAFIIEAYFRTGICNENGVWNYSYQSCREQFQERFPDAEFTNDTFVQHVRRIVDRFRNTASVCKGKSSGRPTVLTEEVVNDVQQRLEVSPRKSLRTLSAQTGLSYGSCQKACKKSLHLHPYKISVLQQLLPPDFQRREQYCHWFNENLNNNNILDKTFFSDEAWFHLSGYVNSQNRRIWSAENPHVFIESPLHPQKVGVWVAMSRRRIIGPIFFDGRINANNYRQTILEPFLNELHDDELQNGLFQQDGATAHTAQATLQYLEEFYGDRLISRNLWPPRSPDLTPLDYFLFGYLKDKVSSVRLHALDELRVTITEAVNNVTPEVLQNVFENMKRRVNLCLQVNGRHFEHLL